MGKTSFAANFPNCAFVIDPQEGGINDLIQFKQCPEPSSITVATGWLHLLKICASLSSQREIETVVFDSMTGMEQLCFKYHCKEYFEDDWSSKGFLSYMQGPKNAAKRDWPEFIDALENLRTSGKNVMLIGHDQVKTFNNPSGADYDRNVPFLDKATWAVTHRWATLIMYYHFHVDLMKVGIKTKTKDDTQRRLIGTTRSSHYDGKNRYELDPIIQAGDSPAKAYQAFSKAYDKCKK